MVQGGGGAFLGSGGPSLSFFIESPAHQQALTVPAQIYGAAHHSKAGGAETDKNLPGMREWD